MNRIHRWFALACALLAVSVVWIGVSPAGGQPGKDEKTSKTKPMPWTFKDVPPATPDKMAAFVKKWLEQGVTFTHAKPTTMKEANPVVRVALHGKIVMDEQLAAAAEMVKKGEVEGVDFREVKELVISHTSVTDAGLKQLALLPGLERLHLHTNPGITDAGLEAVGALAKLKELQLHQAHVTNDGLKHLHGLKALHVLDLEHTKVTAAGLGALSHLRLNRLTLPPAGKTEDGLKAYLSVLNFDAKHAVEAKQKPPLDLTGWHLTAASIPVIGAVVGKHELAGVLVSGKTITDEWLAAAAKALPQMEALTLSHTAVTDKGLEALKGMKLRGLILNGTGVTDAGLALIQGMSLAEKGVLSLDGTQVTKDGVKQFREKHPNWVVLKSEAAPVVPKGR